MKKYKILLITIAVMLALGLPSVANSQSPVGVGGSGVDIQAFETDGAVNPLAAISYDFDRGVMVLVKWHNSELGIFSITNTKIVWRFRIYAFDDGVHRTEPEAFSVSAIDAARSGEKIQIKVYKESDPRNAKWASAVSPASADVALNPVVDGDVIYVEVTYPTGFLPGYDSSGYLLRWTLFNTGWVW